jgi:di/tricarboxylate transporter
MLTSSAIITLCILLAAILLFVFTRIRADLVGLMILLALGLSGIVDSKSAFSGFSNSAVMTILAISMVSVALQQTGATHALGQAIFRIGKGSETKLILFVMLASAGLSLFMNNIAAVGVLLPAVMSLSRRSQVSPRKLLMPLAFGTILGGMATLLTTSNIIVSGALKEAGLKSFGLLDFFPVGAPVVVVGIIYMLTLGRRLLASKETLLGQSTTPIQTNNLSQTYMLPGYLKKLRVQAGSPLIGETLKSCHLSEHGINLFAVQSGNKLNFNISIGDIFKTNDCLISNTCCSSDELKALGLEEVQEAVSEQFFIENGYALSEFVIAPHSTLVGKNLAELQFRSRFGINVLAFWRDGKPTVEQLNNLTLRFGDALLVLGTAERIRQLQKQKDFILTEEDPDMIFKPRKRSLAIIITLLTLGFAATGLLSVAEVVLLGAVLLLLTGCMTLNDAYQTIEWKAIFLIAGMWPLSIAIQQTGLASTLIGSLIQKVGDIPPLVVVALFLLLAMIFTQLMSGQISAIVLIPLALTAASTLQISPQALGIAVALGCSLAFPTPLGHPVNIMVMNPGGYTFKDFLKVGFPLSLLAFLTILMGIHFVYGL